MSRKISIALLSLLIFSSLNAATTICKWKDNKTGAFVMSFDDAMCTHNNYGVPMMVSKGLTGTFLMPTGNLLYGYKIHTWESLASRMGFDFMNHSFYHAGVPQSLAEMLDQCDRNNAVIWSLRTPGASKLNIFALSGSWNPATYPVLAAYYSQIAPALPAHYCLPTLDCRGPDVGDTYEGASGGLAGAMLALNRAVTNAEFTGYHWHGIGAQAEYLYFDRGWTAPDFATFVDNLVTYSSFVWITTTLDAHKYKFERLSNSQVSDNTVSNTVYVTLTSTAPAELYDYPLTLITDVPAGWTHCKITQENRVTITTVTANQVMYGAIPNRGQATLVQASGFDTTPPTLPNAVRDGTSADVSVITNLNQISANWDAATDAETGIAKYWYKVGTTAGGSEVFDWIDNGTFTWVTTSRTNLSLSRGTAYYVTVKAVNGGGLHSTPMTSNGQTGQDLSGYVKFSDDFETGDFTRWTTTTQSGSNTIQVLDGAGYAGTKGVKVHMQGTNAATIAKTNLTGMADTYIQFYVKFVDFNLPLLNHMGENDAGSKTFNILKLLGASGNFIGSMYMGRAENGLNIYFEYIETPASGNSYQSVPSWPGQYWGWLPISTNVWHCVDVHFKADSTQNGGLEMWIDQEKVFSYLHRPTPNATITNMTFGLMSIGSNTVSGDLYLDNIKVSDSYIYVAQSAPPPPPLDTTPPSAPVAVRDGTGTDITQTNSSTQLSANWDVSADAESGIAKYWYAIGTSPSAQDVLAWQDNGTATSVTKTGLALITGQAYYFTVKAENGASLPGAATNSNGQTVNPDAPPPGTVLPPTYPNPYSLSSGLPMKFHIANTSGGEVKIFTMTGRLVKKLSIPAGSDTVDWNVLNESGEKIKPGLYIAKVTDNSGGTSTRKIALK